MMTTAPEDHAQLLAAPAASATPEPAAPVPVPSPQTEPAAPAAVAPPQAEAAPSVEAIRAEAAEVAQVCAQAARLGIQIDAADAVAKGVKPEALRAKVLADLAARSDAAGIIATAPVGIPSTGAKDGPLIAAAKQTAAASR